MLMLGAVMLSSCQGEEQDAGPQAAARIFTLDVSLGLQPEGKMPITRAPGDPGTYEEFVFPEHAYAYLVADNGSTVTVCQRTDKGGTAQSPSFTLDATKWRKTIHTLAEPQTMGDSIYIYLDKLYFSIPSTTVAARLYVAMSKQPLHNVTSITAGTSTEADVQAITFDVVSSSEAAAEQQADRDAIQHIYSSPYNYQLDGRYYGTTDATADRLSLMLYHVAAKVDLMWNVDKAQQATNRLTYIQTRKLKQQGCKLFRPTENSWTAADDASHYAQDLMDDDVSRQWYGRQYYYAIPYKVSDKYPIYLHILKNGDDKDTNVEGGYNLTIKRTPTSTVFVPWLRGDLKFTNTITYGNAEK